MSYGRKKSYNIGLCFRIHKTSFFSDRTNGLMKLEYFVHGKPFQPHVIEHSSLLDPFISYKENEVFNMVLEPNFINLYLP